MDEKSDTTKQERKDKPLDEHNDISNANEDMNRQFKESGDEPPPHSEKVGGLRGNPS